MPVGTYGSVLMDRDKIIWETAWKYYAQMMLYGYALERDGYEVERASLLMIPRDASTDVLPGAARTLVFQYRRAVAEAVLGRFSELVTRVRGEKKNEGGVPTGINTGVSILPWFSSKVPRRA